MARGNNVNNDWMDSCANGASVVGKVKKVIVNTDKVLKFSIDVANKTATGKFSHSFLTITSFTYEGEVKEGDMVSVVGYLATSSYNGKFSTEIIASDIEIK